MNVTVVIPCYNEAPENLTEAVASVPKDPGTEVIVVDDGSTRRETLEVMDSLGGEVIHQVNAGVAAARNTGIAAGTGLYVLPLDSDDWLRPGFLEPLVRHMDNHDSAIATTACQCFGHKQERLVPPALVTASQIATKCDILNTSLFRRSDWEDLGGYDETLWKGFEDWEWWTRLLLHTGSTAQRVDGPEYMYRVSECGRNHTNYAGVDALINTRKAMIRNNPDFVDHLFDGLLNDVRLAYEQGQNQSPIAAEATRQAQYWARRYGKLEGLRSRLAFLHNRT